MSRSIPTSRRGRIAAFAAMLASTLALSIAVPAAQASTAPVGPKVTHQQAADSGAAVHHDTSLPLRELAARSNATAASTKHKKVDDEPVLPHPAAAKTPDPVVQTSTGTSSPLVSTSSNFAGIGSDTGYSVTGVPPDPNSAVGSTQIVETVNTAYAVYSKTGTTILGATNTSALWSGFGGYCQSANDGDATVAWDSLASRWIVQQFANVSSSTGPFYECVAVSSSADATGSYYRYAYSFSTFPDYPKLSVWPDAYYTTYNMFSADGTAFDYAETCAMNRANMLTGAAATQQCFKTSSSYGGVLAASVDGSTAPPSGEAETVVGMGLTSTTLAYWRFHVDWTTPANSTWTGPSTLTVASYSPACSGTTCIPQKGTSQQLDSLADRLMYRFAYRNFGSYESFVVDHAVTANSGVGMRWYELRMSSGTPTVYQQGTYAPDSTYRWMGSIAQDKVGNIAMGYSQSSSTTYPSIRFTGRLAADTLGTMTQGETTIITGGGSQTSYSRWGDYTSMQIDPSNGCTFWYTDEYEPSTGNFNWATRIASFTLPNCASTTSGAITSGISGKCVDDWQDSSTNGNKVDLYTCNGAAAQNWTASNGTLQINGKCMDVTGQGTSNGTLIELYTCNGGSNQQWTATNGELVSTQSGKCLDDPASSTTDGTQLEIWTCNGGSNQKWTLP